MKMLEKIDWTVLNTYIENNLIVSNKHPDYDIWILNYTPKTSFSKLWDEYTLSCRGLVIDINGKILARPFQKFKNYEEHDPSEIDMSLDYEIFEKMDGSLIILFYYDVIGKWLVASRGSFISEQSEEARKMLDNNATFDLFLNVLYKNSTYIFEILYMENRIVVDYGKRWELVLLARVNTITGEEADYNSLNLQYSKYFSIVKRHDIKINNLMDLKKLEEDNREGFVIRFVNGFRVKVKFDEYCRLHSILTNVSNITVWEHLMNNYDFDILTDKIPDEMYVWLKYMIKKLENDFKEIERIALKEFTRIYYINNINTRKEFAFEALKSDYQSILFALFDKKSYDQIIWKMIKPKYSKPFRDGYEYIA